MKQTHCLTIFVAAALAATASSHAAIYAPYPADSETLHLWHMDTPAPVVDTAPAGGTNLVGLLNGATLTDASYPGFGTALNTMDGGQDSTTERNALLTASSATPTPGNVTLTVANTVSGAFTFEAIVWIGFDPLKNFGTVANGGNGRNTPFNIISAESSANGNRIFQFRIMPIGASAAAVTGPMLTFENVRMVSGNQPSIYAAIPMEGPDAIVSNAWYHVAVTYNGVPNTDGNLKFYWTRLDPARETATEIAIISSPANLSGLNPMATITSPFMVGNDGRNRNSNFMGLVDEVRISRVARPANGMMFGPATPQIVQHPENETVAPGQPASFTVVGTGLPPITYQWRHNSTPIPGATNATYTIAAAQSGDAGTYDVVLANGAGSSTSSPATLVVRSPRTIYWAGYDRWSTTIENWDLNRDTIPDTTYIQGDDVIFDGMGTPFVYLNEPMHPNSVLVAGSIDYTFTTDMGGRLERNTPLTKMGSTSTLTIETQNTSTGPVAIREGTLQVGSAMAAGSLGSAPLTNDSILTVYSGSASPSVSSGAGSIYIEAAGNLSLQTNTMNGPIVMTGGSLTFNGPQSKGAHTDLTMNATANPGPRLNLSNASLDSSLTIHMYGTTASPDTRCTITALSGTNSITSLLELYGDGTIQANGSADGQLTLPAINAPNFMGKLILRGGGTNIVNGPITVGKQCSVADSSTWILKGANSWPYGEAAQGATMRMGAPGALPPSSAFNIFGGTLDLAGISQQVAYLNSTNTGSPYATNFTGLVGNSSTSGDAVLTLNTTQPDNLLAAAVVDSVRGGTRRTGLTLSGTGTLTMANPTNTYTGDTLINGGTLALWGGGAIPNSGNIVVAPGATLSAAQRTDATLTLGPAQTLKGNGAINLAGNLAGQGTIELKVAKSGTTFTTDRVQGLSTVTYGGTLRLVLSGSAVVAGDSFKLFDAAAYSGAFAEIDPPTPGAGLAWDTANLTVNGTLGVKAAGGPDPTPTDISFSISGNTLELQWPATHTGWVLQAQTNSLSAGIGNNWVSLLATGSTNRVFITTDPNQGAVFYRLILP